MCLAAQIVGNYPRLPFRHGDEKILEQDVRTRQAIARQGADWDPATPPLNQPNSLQYHDYRVLHKCRNVALFA
jgi:hypothetical protein